MMDTYATGPDLSPFFQVPKRTAQVELPNPFDMTCRSCGAGVLERTTIALWTTRKPFAILQCDACHDFLYLFGDVKDPLVVSGSKLRGTTTFSRDVDRMFAERELDRQRKITRTEGALVPPPPAEHPLAVSPEHDIDTSLLHK
jgi:hypothetical protein